MMEANVLLTVMKERVSRMRDVNIALTLLMIQTFYQLVKHVLSTIILFLILNVTNAEQDLLLL